MYQSLKHADFSFQEGSQVVLLGHQAHRGLMMLSLAEQSPLEFIKSEPTGRDHVVTFGAVHGFNTNRHRPLHEFDR